jgi:hypothetical protein
VWELCAVVRLVIVLLLHLLEFAMKPIVVVVTRMVVVVVVVIVVVEVMVRLVLDVEVEVEVEAVVRLFPMVKLAHFPRFVKVSNRRDVASETTTVRCHRRNLLGT